MEKNNPGEARRILVKYGGNAMVDESQKTAVIDHICRIREMGNEVVLAHGGGPFIRDMLEMARIDSEFIDGHRKTSLEAVKYVEMALKGSVNGNLVNLINRRGLRAVGLSGKDGRMVEARKRMHMQRHEDGQREVDLGQVGDVALIDTSLIELLLSRDYLPVITSLASDPAGLDYNINADIFAGSMAGALKADEFIVLTDVDGLMRDLDDPGTLIRRTQVEEIRRMIDGGELRGGMIPKLEACEVALKNGARKARIINGTRPEQLMQAMEDDKTGTLITS